MLHPRYAYAGGKDPWHKAVVCGDGHRRVPADHCTCAEPKRCYEHRNLIEAPRDCYCRGKCWTCGRKILQPGTVVPFDWEEGR